MKFGKIQIDVCYNLEEEHLFSKRVAIGKKRWDWSVGDRSLVRRILADNYQPQRGFNVSDVSLSREPGFFINSMWSSLIRYAPLT